MAKVRNSIAVGSALMAVALLFTGPLESPGGKPKLKAYYDQGRVVTICNGITGPDITIDMEVTDEWCDNRFAEEIEKHSKPLDKVGYQMSPRARLAWSDFLFNLGTGIAKETTTPWRRLIAGDVNGSCDAFLMYKFTPVNGVKRDCSLKTSRCDGIWKRRNAERDLCQGRISQAKFLELIESLPRGGEL